MLLILVLQNKKILYIQLPYNQNEILGKFYKHDRVKKLKLRVLLGEWEKFKRKNPKKEARK